MAKFIATMFLWFSLYGVGIMTMIKAWGLQVQSFGWLAFGYVLMFVITIVMAVVSRD